MALSADARIQQVYNRRADTDAAHRVLVRVADVRRRKSRGGPPVVYGAVLQRGAAANVARAKRGGLWPGS